MRRRRGHVVGRPAAAGAAAPRDRRTRELAGWSNWAFLDWRQQRGRASGLGGKGLLAHGATLGERATLGTPRQVGYLARLLEFSRWGAVFGGERMAAAVIDRVVRHGRLLQFRCESYRVRRALMQARDRSERALRSRGQTARFPMPFLSHAIDKARPSEARGEGGRQPRRAGK